MNTPTAPTRAPIVGPSPIAESASLAVDRQREQVRQALEQRFRYHLRTGQISPLLHLVMKYKLENLS